MDRVQLITLRCGLGLLLLVSVVPQWRYDDVDQRVNYAICVDKRIGRGFIFSPPRYGAVEMRIDVGQLIAEITAIVSITGLIVVALARLPTPSHPATRET